MNQPHAREKRVVNKKVTVSKQTTRQNKKTSLFSIIGNLLRGLFK